ncbi:MAG: hypothetical protein Q9166_006950 [cf. Caloplaca sp. 2 TL-2023]
MVDVELAKAFPNKQQRLAYYQWYASPIFKRINNVEGTEQQYCPDAPTLINRLMSTDYTNPKEVWDLAMLKLLDRRPVILIGQSRKISYEVLFSTRLEAKPLKLPETRDVQMDHILGINANVEPVELPKKYEPPSASVVQRRKRSDFLSSESHESTESDSVDFTTFNIMYQIGILRVYAGTSTNQSEAIKDVYGWSDTGFVVVLDITNGKARGVWIVYNFNPVSPEGDRYRVENEDDWGWLPGYEGHDKQDFQFSVAKIADKLSDLKAGREFKLQNQLRYEPELVRVVKNGMGNLQRQTVEEKDLNMSGLPP